MTTIKILFASALIVATSTAAFAEGAGRGRDNGDLSASIHAFNRANSAAERSSGEYTSAPGTAAREPLAGRQNPAPNSRNPAYRGDVRFGANR